MLYDLALKGDSLLSYSLVSPLLLASLELDLFLENGDRESLLLLYMDTEGCKVELELRISLPLARAVSARFFIFSLEDSPKVALRRCLTLFLGSWLIVHQDDLPAS